MRFELTNIAQKDLQKLNRLTQKQIVKKLQFYQQQPDPLKFATKLTNFSEGGNYRFRIGQYRIVFDVAKDKIYILHIEHCRDVYRRR